MLYKTLFPKAALVLVIFLNDVSIKAQERAYLDATQIQIRQRQREAATGSGGGVVTGSTDGRMPSAQPLDISLKISINTGFVRGEVFEYEVQIRNISDGPVEVPWDLSPADIEPADPRTPYQYQTAGIYLNAKLGNNRPVSLDGPILLFGTPSIASTMVKLRPGEWVRIKAKARAVPANPNDAWPPSGLTSKTVDGSVTAQLILAATYFSRATNGNSHEESQIAKGPIASNASTVQFRF